MYYVKYAQAYRQQYAYEILWMKTWEYCHVFITSEQNKNTTNRFDTIVLLITYNQLYTNLFVWKTLRIYCVIDWLWDCEIANFTTKTK